MTRAGWIDFPWTIAVCAAALVATACARSPWGAELADLLVADGRLASGQLWRAITGPLVHATWGHLVRDVALTAIVGAAYERPLGRAWPALVLVSLAVPTLVSLGAGGVTAYYGLSGLSHAQIAAAVGVELAWRRGTGQVHAGLVGAALLGKVGYEMVTGGPAFPMDLGDSVRQLPIAHAAGVAVGAFLAWPIGRRGRGGAPAGSEKLRSVPSEQGSGPVPSPATRPAARRASRA